MHNAVRIKNKILLVAPKEIKLRSPANANATAIDTCHILNTTTKGENQDAHLPCLSYSRPVPRVILRASHLAACSPTYTRTR